MSQEILNYLKNFAEGVENAKNKDEIMRNTEDINIQTFYRHMRTLTKYGVKQTLYYKNTKLGRQKVKCWYCEL